MRLRQLFFDINEQRTVMQEILHSKSFNRFIQNVRCEGSIKVYKNGITNCTMDVNNENMFKSKQVCLKAIITSESDEILHLEQDGNIKLHSRFTSFFKTGKTRRRTIYLSNVLNIQRAIHIAPNALPTSETDQWLKETEISLQNMFDQLRRARVLADGYMDSLVTDLEMRITKLKMQRDEYIHNAEQDARKVLLDSHVDIQIS